MTNEDDVATVPRAAATVMLVRDRTQGGLEVYLTRRSARSAFMPDAFVFPGGALESADDDPETLSRLDAAPSRVEPHFAIAAIRELFEEAGVLLARSQRGASLRASDMPALAAARKALNEGSTFAQILARNGWRLDGNALAYYSHWITPLAQARRFDTRFFIARAPEGQDALADAVEVHDGAWLAPADAIAGADAGKLEVVFPTRKHLERLAEFANVDAALARAYERSPFAVTPRVDADGTPILPDEPW